MARIPLIHDGVVINVIELEPDADYTPPHEGHEIGPEGGEMGHLWDGEKYTVPEPELESEPDPGSAVGGPVVTE